MAANPETKFIASVHRHLPPEQTFHREKMANPYRGGTADCWYDGKTDMWIEWKFIALPKRPGTVIDLVGGKNPALSHLQQDWIRCRLANGRKVWVGVGCTEGCVFYTDATWDQPIIAADFRQRLITRQTAALLILKACGL